MNKQEAENIQTTATLFGVRSEITQLSDPEHFAVMLLKPGMTQSTIDYARACENVIEWGMSKRRIDAAAGRIGIRGDG